MNGSKFLRLLAPALSISFYATMLLGISPAYTQPLNLKNIDFIEPANLPTLPYLGRRSQAGLHGCSCGCQQPTFTAVLPKSTLGLTTAKHPTFFFYLPETDRPKTKVGASSRVYVVG